MDTIYLIIKVLVIVVMMFLTANIFTNKESGKKTLELFALASFLLMLAGVVITVIELAYRFGVVNSSYTFNGLDILFDFSVIYIVLYAVNKICKKNPVK